MLWRGGSYGGNVVNIFYVYIHYCEKGYRKDSPFHVGKGCFRRFKQTSDRNPKWNKIANKYGFRYEIVQDNMSESDAFLLEMWLIAKFRHQGYDLANLTDGGEGNSGYRHTDEQRKKLSAAKMGIQMSDDFKRKCSERMKGVSTRKGQKTSEETKERISKSKSGRASYTYDHTKYRFENTETGQTFTGTSHDLLLKYGLLSSSITKIKQGKLKTHKNWRLIP
jgi:hypothetical protein